MFKMVALGLTLCTLPTVVQAQPPTHALSKRIPLSDSTYIAFNIDRAKPLPKLIPYRHVGGTSTLFKPAVTVTLGIKF